ncbi:uroporphyrinogen-III synthase [Sphingopyxis kveilinensis]|uniref:uroporphyrinogen-III synthase n=1 Tax=Sphingopyxis kveilinensis TaxID=3114367 RepID=UPI0030CC6085
MSGGAPLIVTRPEPGNAATVARARSLGFDVRAMPLFAARPLDWVPPAAADFDALLLTSAFAGRLAGPGLGALATLPAYAVGTATADSAAAAGLTVAMTGAADAKWLLDEMTSRNIQRILWLCGRERSAPDAGDAIVTALPCYAIDPVDPPPAWDNLIGAPAILLAHSARAAGRLAALAAANRAHLSLVAISPAVAAAAGEGWRNVAIAAQPGDAAMLAQARALWHKGIK